MFLVADFEATCWEGREHQASDMEITELGFVLVKDCKIHAQFQDFVRPTLYPVLSDFCQNLTHIFQVNVDSADTLDVNLRRLEEFIKIEVGVQLSTLAWGSWGAFDRRIMTTQCNALGIPYPMGHHVNFKEEFDLYLRESKFEKGKKTKVGVKKALDYMGMTFEGNHHRALDDAYNITRIVAKCNLMLRAMTRGLKGSQLILMESILKNEWGMDPF